MNKLSVMRGLVFFTSFIVVIALLWFIESAIKQYNQVNASWTNYSDNEAIIVETVLELNAHLGYGGMIHHFKNYIMRGEPNYELLLIDIATIKYKLETLENYFETKKELQALKIIRDVVNEYAKKIAIASRMRHLGNSIKEIDNTVKINDQAALAALETIHDETVKRSLEVQLETDLLMEKADKFLAQGRFLVIPVILFAVLLFYYIRQMKKTSDKVLESQKRAETALIQLHKAQDSLVESRKMAALGELVAGVAHEINTPIGNALSSSTFINDQTIKVSKLYNDEDLSADELEEYLSHAVDATKLIASNLVRAADLINSFKSMAVDQTGGEKRSFELDEYIHEVLLSIHPIIKKSNISVSHSCDKDIVMNTYPGALSQCLSNLVINGIIHGFSPEEKGHIIIHADYNNNTGNVLLSISDNGKGIPESLHKKIYEPFYTTKRSQGGSGLGLQIVHNLVCHNLGGSIKIKSTEGKGTTFILALPREFTISQTIEEQK